MDTMDVYDENDICTGDILLYQSNSPSSNIQRLCTKSMWNHVGIAVRLSDPNDYTSVVSGNVGFLCSLDFVNVPTLDVVSRSKNTGLALVPIGLMKVKYSSIAVRPLIKKYSGYYIVEKILEHIENHKNDSFASILTVIGPWIGTSLRTENTTTFCSENVGQFLISMGEEIKHTNLGLMAPRDLAPDALELIKYENQLYMYNKKYSPLSETIATLLLLTIIIVIIVTYFLPRNFDDRLKYI